MKEKQKCRMDLDRVYIVRSEVRKILIMDYDVEAIKHVRDEFEKLDKWHKDMEEVMIYN
jgi:hypothetical protein